MAANFYSNINGSFFVTTTGSIGIGSWSTSDTLGYDLNIKSNNAQISLESTHASGATYILTSGASDSFAITKDGVGDRLTISSAGVLTVNQTGMHILENNVTPVFTPSGFGDNLIISSASSTGITLYSATSGFGSIIFADSDSNEEGYLRYYHATDEFAFSDLVSGITPTAAANFTTKAYVDGLTTGTVKGTGTATRVAFWSASDTISSNEHLYWDNTNDRLGIGVGSAPLKKLNVQGTVRIQTNTSYYSDRTYLGDTWEFASDTTDGVTFSITGGLAATAGNYFRWLTQEGAATPIEKMRIDSSGRLIVQSGTLTVPAYTPAQGYPLHVQGIASQSLISIGRAGQTTGSQGMIVGIDTTSSYLWNRDNVNITFGCGDLEKLRISPSAQSLRVKGGSVTGSNYMQFVNSAGTSQGYFGYGGASNVLYMVQQVDGDMQFYSNSATRMTIKTDGNVGIGTTSPSAKLSNSAILNAAASGLGTTVLGLNWEVPAGASSQGYVASFANTQTAAANANAGVLIEVGSTDTTTRLLSVESGGVNRFEVRGDGNVGIGTTSPDTKLHISSAALSDIRLENTGTAITSGDNYGQIEWEGNDYNTSANGIRASIQVKGYGAGTQGETAMYFRTSYVGADSNVDRMIIDHSGVVILNPTHHIDGGFINSYRALISVSTSAVGISKVATYGGLAMVWMNYAGNIGYDLVSYSLSQVTVLSSQSISGGPASRTYTAVSGILKVAMGSGTYDVYATEMRTANS